MSDHPVEQCEDCIRRLREGDESARSELFDLAHDRLLRLTRKMLKGFPVVGRWEQTDDVWQNAGLRMWKSLEKVTLQDSRHFFNLAALQIRRELIEMARHFRGPLGLAANYATTPEADSRDARTGDKLQPADQTHEASQLASWTELHEHVQRLSEEDREVFELLWYDGLSQAQVAALLKVSVRTVKRRWQSARLALCDKLQEALV